MRALLMTVVLLIAVVLIYEQVTGGDEGTHNQLKQSGEHISGSIRRMSP